MGRNDDVIPGGDVFLDLGAEVNEAAPESREPLLQSGDSFIAPVDSLPSLLSNWIAGATDSSPVE
jgi:hypothetical protein